MDLDPRKLRILLAVARAGSVLAASQELFITPSAVSQQLTRLEREAGRALVRRTPRGTMLTPAGLIVVEAAEEIERAIGSAGDRLRTSDGPSGTVRIGGVASFLRSLVIPRLTDWRQRYPQLEVEITEGDLDVMTKALRRRELDLAVLEYDSDVESVPLPVGMIEQPLLDEPWKLVVPAGRLVERDLVDLSRVSLPWLGAAGGAGASAVQRLRKTAALDATPVHHFYETLTGLSLVAAGQGIAVMPALALRGIVPDNVDVLDLPGLGTRRIVLRRFAKMRSADGPVDTLIGLIRESVNEFDVHAG
ncbi:LysR family transcriptional regulator [Microbacterium sp. A196]|uniref:LysR family transcriptional regulator n=1 Tax=Microbacterium sp. A196 TaxID=3457320 RepID=UPI003FD62711